MTFSSEVVLRCLQLTKNYRIVGYKLNITKMNEASSAFRVGNLLLGIYYIFKLRLKLLG